MDIFEIFESVWDENEGEMVETDKVIGYRAISQFGEVLGEGETPSEATEKALIASYPVPRKIKFNSRFDSSLKKVSQRR